MAILCIADGFIAEKPEVQRVGTKRTPKTEFDVVSSRRAMENGEWKTFWERATFVAWGEEAEKIGERLEKGSEVQCIGEQETHTYTPEGSTQKRRIVKHKLVRWEKKFQQRRSDEAPGGESRQGGQSRRPDDTRSAGEGRGGWQSRRSEGAAPPQDRPARPTPAGRPPQDQEDDQFPGPSGTDDHDYGGHDERPAAPPPREFIEM